MEHCIPGIPRIINVYEENEQLTLIEEYISGISLQEMIDNRAITLEFIVQLMNELCTILEQLHVLNPPIIHRDIKPSNIMISSCGHAILIDFNAAKFFTDTAKCQDTVLLGTKGYAAPEQYGFGSSTPQTDIYARGIILKELSLALPVPTTVFDAIISKCTEMNPSDRMDSVQELKSEINQLLNGDSNHSKATSSDDSLTLLQRKFTLPGFRTKTPWKMLIASMGYILIVGASFLGEVKDETGTSLEGIHLWIQSIAAFCTLLSIVFCSFNYCNVQSIIPLCTSKKRGMRYLGIFILNIAVIFFLMLVMSLLQSII